MLALQFVQTFLLVVRAPRVGALGQCLEVRGMPLTEGGAFYRTIAPSPDGRFFAATLTWDAGWRPLDALLGAPQEQVRLLDASGREVAGLEASRRHANHSPDWGP